MEMTMLKFLTEQGLLRTTDNRIAEMKKLTADDRAWLAARAKIEYDIDIVAPTQK